MPSSHCMQELRSAARGLSSAFTVLNTRCCSALRVQLSWEPDSSSEDRPVYRLLVEQQASVTHPKNHAVDFHYFFKKKKKKKHKQEPRSTKKKSLLWVTNEMHSVHIEASIRKEHCSVQRWETQPCTYQKEMAMLCSDMLLHWVWPSRWGTGGLSALLKGLFVCLFVESG